MISDTKKQSLVLCEGEADVRVLRTIASKANVDNLRVEPFYGKDKLPERLNVLKNEPDFTSNRLNRILVTRDADDGWKNAWDAASNAVKSVFGVELKEAGEWKQIGGGPEIALWLAPRDQSEGMIETLCLQAARESNPVSFECLDAYTDCLQEKQGIELHEKERFEIWTLAAEGPVRGRKRLDFNQALERLDFNWNSEAFTEIRELLRAMGNAD